MSIRGASPMLSALANSRGDGGTPHPGRTCDRRITVVLTGRFGFHARNRAPFAFSTIYTRQWLASWCLRHGFKLVSRLSRLTPPTWPRKARPFIGVGGPCKGMPVGVRPKDNALLDGSDAPHRVPKSSYITKENSRDQTHVCQVQN